MCTNTQEFYQYKIAIHACFHTVVFSIHLENLIFLPCTGGRVFRSNVNFPFLSNPLGTGARLPISHPPPHLTSEKSPSCSSKTPPKDQFHLCTRHFAEAPASVSTRLKPLLRDRCVTVRESSPGAQRFPCAGLRVRVVKDGRQPLPGKLCASLPWNKVGYSSRAELNTGLETSIHHCQEA